MLMILLSLLIHILGLGLIQRILLILSLRLLIRLPLSKILGKPILITMEALFGTKNLVAPLDFPIFLEESLHRTGIVMLLDLVVVIKQFPLSRNKTIGINQLEDLDESPSIIKQLL